MGTNRELDTIAYGAIGSTRRLVSKKQYQKYYVNRDVSWAVSGGRVERFQANRDEIAMISSKNVRRPDFVLNHQHGAVLSYDEVIHTGPYKYEI